MDLDEHAIALAFDKVLNNLSKYAVSPLSRGACLDLEILDNPAKIE